jgi:hypothetical protein
MASAILARAARLGQARLHALRLLDRSGWLIGTGDRMDDGRNARGLAMLVTLQFGKGL